MLFLVVVVASTASLAACGGSPSGAPSPTPSPQPIPAQVTVPDPIGYDADHLELFNRMNALRLSAGLGEFAQNSKLDRAAQAHVDWILANNSLSHVEVPNSRGFTGVNWWDRDLAAEYDPLEGTEVMSTGFAPRVAFDALLNVAYHRAGILQFERVDIGIGYSMSGIGYPGLLVAEIAVPDDGSARSAGQQPLDSTGGVVVWPLDGAQQVPRFMGNEIPNPVPAKDVLTLGTPVSISVLSTEKLTVESFRLFEDGSGVPVGTTLLTSNTDPHQTLPPSVAEIIPDVGLRPSERYRAEFVGRALSDDLSQRDVSRAWRFTTGDFEYPSTGWN